MRKTKVKRNTIPPDVSAKALFLSDRTCCVCRKRGKPVQIHHIDDNKSNNDIGNLAILCLDCHTETQISGGFHRKLDADQIVLYRDDWLRLVARERWNTLLTDEETYARPSLDLELITTVLDVLKENKEYDLLAMHYHTIGNTELRDKYIDLALSRKIDAETEMYLRKIQDKIELVDPKRIKRRIDRLKKSANWSQLDRLYADVKDCEQATFYYCRSICEDLQESNVFSAAYYLKEMNEKELDMSLFEKAYRGFCEKNDLWWQVRSLQELGWESELKALILSNRVEIEQSGDLRLLELLYAITGEKDKLIEIARKTSIER